MGVLTGHRYMSNDLFFVDFHYKIKRNILDYAVFLLFLIYFAQECTRVVRLGLLELVYGARYDVHVFLKIQFLFHTLDIVPSI